MAKLLVILILLFPLVSSGQSYWMDHMHQATSFKAHVTTLQKVTKINVWRSFTGFTIVQNESPGNLAMLKNDSCVMVKKEGLYQFGGCVHYKDNLGTGFNDLTILTRINVNGNDEARCSQRGKTMTLRADGEDVLSYNGTAYLKQGDCVYLQYLTDQIDLEFYSSSLFDKQVAVTIWLNYLGK